MKQTNIIIIVVVVLILLGLSFYWFQWRPSKAREKCYEELSKKSPAYQRVNGESFIDTCLTKYGIEN